MKNEKVQELYERLVSGVAQVYDSATWKEVLAVQSRFHNYSFNNTFLIWLQMPTATRVAGFHTWKELGRHVKKGEKALKIFAPLIKTVTVEENEEDGAEQPVTRQRLCGFRVVNVFDVSQTEGKPLPSLTEELTGNSEVAAKLLEALQHVIDVPVSFAETGKAKGYYDPSAHRIVIKPGMATDQTAKTLIHEYVHSLLHHKDSDRKEKRRSQVEAEAEGTAYVVANYFGLDTSDYSFGYVASWAHEENGVELVQKVGTTIQQTANTIITALEAQLKRQCSGQVAQGA
ncbi:ArdC-like ssDNA-binding domain-containing protein [Alicyclobacillus macrosporangiidus]|uniref:Uncharacterized protein n=1 Tax=Alicyclobacillus macrosporangiidus TaxID=392015 RepID=A0A1I7L1W9_9BACL|nr:ArdC-like ssDNA-binding domain-containing protein [Alicyclobacillus macrosporangiidus]SFV03618.1 protein of unknown function [Alicyclobacillus macrosporangiidus]